MPSLGRGKPKETRTMGKRRLSRRELLYGTAALPLLSTGARLAAQDAAPRQSGLIIREKEPENLEFPFSSLDSFITPNERFYIRSHFGVPKIDAAEWRLKVEGAVEHELEDTYDDLAKHANKGNKMAT